ncbi:MAG: thermonuclease family protein [Sulfuritalea sp.]|nr:thermonuclease family protein [Sulfuritalea sp.]
MKRYLLVLGLLLRAAPLFADTLSGRVVSVAGGDTIAIRDGSKARHKVWLAGIDAPKHKQPYAQASKQHLSDLVLGREVMIDWRERDRYGRVVGKVLVQAPTVRTARRRSMPGWPGGIGNTVASSPSTIRGATNMPNSMRRPGGLSAAF